MNWDHWYQEYDHSPSLQARLRIMRQQIAAALDESAPGPIHVVSICAGDGRDLVGAWRSIRAARMSWHGCWICTPSR